MDNDFILTTANNLEGYTIVKQCGLVTGDYLFLQDFGMRNGNLLRVIEE